MNISIIITITINDIVIAIGSFLPLLSKLSYDLALFCYLSLSLLFSLLVLLYRCYHKLIVVVFNITVTDISDVVINYAFSNGFVLKQIRINTNAIKSDRENGKNNDKETNFKRNNEERI